MLRCDAQEGKAQRNRVPIIDRLLDFDDFAEPLEVDPIFAEEQTAKESIPYFGGITTNVLQWPTIEYDWNGFLNWYPLDSPGNPIIRPGTDKDHHGVPVREATSQFSAMQNQSDMTLDGPLKTATRRCRRVKVNKSRCPA